MSLSWERTDAHARERLGRAEADDHTAQAATLRRFLALESERLRMRHRFGLGGAEIASGRSYVVDVVVQHVCRAAAEAVGMPLDEACGVVALGGYGRGELSPFSDVDLLFLHGGASTQLRAFTEHVLKLLWDGGLNVGHSFRSPRECVAAAREDLVTRSALAETRLVAGSPALFRRLLQLMEALRQDDGATEAFIGALRRDVQERHARHGRTVCVVEPHVKDGPGGLRDLQAVLWGAQARCGARGLSGLRSAGWISEVECRGARRAYDFLLRVRHEAHFCSGRKTDLLSLDLHADLARNFGYRDCSGLLASEQLMRDYYSRATELFRLCEGLQRSRLRSPRDPVASRGRRSAQRGLAVRDGWLQSSDGAGLQGGAAPLLEVFLRAQQADARLSDGLKRAIRERSHLLDRRFRNTREAGSLLLRLLRQRGRVAPALRALHETGVLGRLLPEFRRVTFLIQHDLFHRYTVDEHTLQAVEALDAVASGCGPGLARLGRAFDETVDAAPLYLGMLLHDVGKGLGGGHVQKGVQRARRALERLRVEPELAEKALFLVGAHLEMSQLSQQRDLTEPSLLDAFASRVGTLERLNLLLLLTYADHKGVGPGVWTEWKAALLWELYDRVRERLVSGPRPGERGPVPLAGVVAALSEQFPALEVERHFALLPERYLRTTDAARMQQHFRLAREIEHGNAALGWSENRSHWSELSVVARDRPGLFATLAGALTARGVDILSVDLFTRGDGVAFDTFHVAELAPGHRALRLERQQAVAAALREALSGRLHVAEAVQAWRQRLPRRARRHAGRAGRGGPAVRFDQTASALATVVEVKAPDQPGLAYTIARAVAALGLDISFARVATAKSLAVDVFYVRDATGAKLGPGLMADVERRLLAALGGGAEGRGAFQGEGR
jgi:[protein-PII] uridylyltransferase